MTLRMLFLDMNAYFASVEQQDNPDLRGRPVGVVPVDVDSSCCIACSYEARAAGVRTGTRVSEARRRCPGIALVRARPERYIEIHHRIVATVEKHLPVETVHSVDEMSCRLMRNEREPADAVAIARRMKQAVYDEVGGHLRCSVGLAPNVLLAKVACEMHKPDGLTVIDHGDLPGALHHLDLRDLPGIARRMEARLHAAGVETVADLCARPKADLRRIWGGIVGERWWHWLRGDETHLAPTRRRCVGHEHVLPPHLRTDRGAWGVALHLACRAAMRMRKLRYWATHLHLFVRPMKENGGPLWEGRARLGSVQDTPAIVEKLRTLWAQRPRRRPMIVGVSLTGLIPDRSATRPLFPGERRRVGLSRTVDTINERHGPNAVYFGSMHGMAVPLRIPFGGVPEVPRATHADLGSPASGYLGAPNRDGYLGSPSRDG
ncbi:MAG TPA: DNA polymerase [Phycisphaerales bacterium]|nr:DNA polymerase [Phycisphaerales bacterium]